MADWFGKKMLNHITIHQKTKILPLRWIGNFCSGFASNHLIKAVNLDESLDANLSFRYKYHAKMWIILNKPYRWWGTYYEIDIKEIKKSVEQSNWDDYDENGIAYWEKE
jgi:hypothetical protein